MVMKMENLKVLLKRGIDDYNDGLQSLYPPQKKRQRMIDIDPSISGFVTSFLQNRRPPKLRLLSFQEAVSNLPKPISKPIPKAKTTTHSQVFERRILPLPLPLGKAADCSGRTTKASTSVKTKTKPSFQKQSTQIPEIISLDLVEAIEKRILPLPLGKAAACPRRTTKASASVKTKTKSISKPSFQKRNPQIPEIISLDLDEAVSKPPQEPTTTPVSEEKNLSFDKTIRTPIPEVSPRRALRAAELKSRFATTIFKAQHHTLFDSAPADVATHKAETTAAMQLRRVREKQREAARIALVKVEEAADGRDNMQMFKELEELCGGALDYPNGPFALDRFGLILKQ